MPRGSLTFKQRDVTRAVKAAQAAGMDVACIEIDKEGKIIILTSRARTAPISAYDAWKGSDAG